MNLKIHNVYQILFGVISLTLIAYALFNARHLLNGPELFINGVNAETNTIETDSKNFTLEGVALYSSYISVNENPITVDEEGMFKETLLLTQELNPVYIIARDRLGKEERRHLIIIYKPDYVEPTFDEIITTIYDEVEKTHGTSSPTSSSDTTTSEEF